MYPGTLTPNQQLSIAAFMPILRSNMMLFSKLVNNLNLLNDLWTNGGISAMNAALTSTDVIPDTTGLAGAQPLSAADLTTAMTAVQAFLTSYHTAAYGAYFVRATGPSNAASV